MTFTMALSSNGVPVVTFGTNHDGSIVHYINILILLFADDIVVFGNSKDDLQFALNKFENFCGV